MHFQTFHQDWQTALEEHRNADAFNILEKARRYTSKAKEEDWNWLAQALQDEKFKFFVAELFQKQPVPKRLFAPMIEAAVHKCDASRNKIFLQPCLETFGKEALLSELARYTDSASAEVRNGFEKALYWATGEVRKKRSTGL